MSHAVRQFEHALKTRAVQCELAAYEPPSELVVSATDAEVMGSDSVKIVQPK